MLKINLFQIDNLQFDYSVINYPGFLPFMINIYPCEPMQESSSSMELIKNAIKADYPSTIINFINQYSPKACEAILECFYIEQQGAIATYENSDNTQAFHLDGDGIDFLCVSSFNSGNERYEEAFNNNSQALSAQKHTYSDVFRQWNYIPNICEHSNTTACEIIGRSEQNEYSKFNEVRKKYYGKAGIRNYPAATGIGISGEKFGLITLSIKGHAQSYYLENDLQVSAFDYSNDIIKQSSIKQSSNQTEESHSLAKPLFSRALILTNNDITNNHITNNKQVQAMLSGTAAIRGEESQCDNVLEQLIITQENINHLLSANNIKRQTPLSISRVEPLSLKVYIKSNSLAEEISQMIPKEFATEQILIVVADICRKELLIEIEGIFNLIPD